ncbi:MAG: thioredoxin fold domain-containing protein [Fimbriimonadaceae bacterium]
MKRYLLPLLLIVTAATGAHASEIGWKKGYSAASSEAKASGKLMMIDFYTDWCGWCKKLDADTYPAPEVVKASESFIPIKLNAEKDADGIRLAKKFKVNGYPTVLFIDGNEKLAYKIVGYAPPKDFAASMAKAATIRQDTAKYEAALKANPNDFDGLTGLASIDASMGDVATAASYADRAAAAVSARNKGKLLSTYNDIGDAFQNASQFDKAIGYFQKAIDPAFPDQTAYARISVAVCYAQAGQPKLAVPFLKALMAMSGAPKEYLDQAKQLLAQIEKS